MTPRLESLLDRFNFFAGQAGAEEAVRRFRRYHGLPETAGGHLELETMTERGYCAHAVFVSDVEPLDALTIATSGILPATACAAAKRTFTYWINSDPNVLTGREVNAIKEAFREWNNLNRVKFSLAESEADADIRFEWRPAGDPDLDMTGPLVIAHADWPVGCPRRRSQTAHTPIHFDRSEKWSVGGVGSGYDVKFVAMHEIGHVVGIPCLGSGGNVMRPTFNGASFTGWSATELQIYAQLYP